MEICMFPTQRPQSIRILAIGSPHGDDQAAWYVADLILERASFHERCAKLRTPWDLLEHLSTPGRCVVIDACRSGAPSGTIHHLTPHDLSGFSNSTTSSHGGGLPAAFRLAEALGYDLSGVSIIAIEAGVCETGAPLSESARRAADELAGWLRHEFASGELAIS
jgi:hydrogenase maturation protease